VSTFSVLAPEAAAQRYYRPRAPDILQRLFRERFSAFAAAYEDKYSARFGTSRLPLIERAAEALRLCGDWRQAILQSIMNLE
jgi:hypothetical protein